MFSNKTTLIICAICYSTLILGGILDVLHYYVVIGIIVFTALLVLIQLIKAPKIKEDDDKFI